MNEPPISGQSAATKHKTPRTGTSSPTTPRTTSNLFEHSVYELGAVPAAHEQLLDPRAQQSSFDLEAGTTLVPLRSMTYTPVAVTAMWSMLALLPRMRRSWRTSIESDELVESGADSLRVVERVVGEAGYTLRFDHTVDFRQGTCNGRDSTGSQTSPGESNLDCPSARSSSPTA